MNLRRPLQHYVVKRQMIGGSDFPPDRFEIGKVLAEGSREDTATEVKTIAVGLFWSED